MAEAFGIAVVAAASGTTIVAAASDTIVVAAASGTTVIEAASGTTVIEAEASCCFIVAINQIGDMATTKTMAVLRIVKKASTGKVLASLAASIS